MMKKHKETAPRRKPVTEKPRRARKKDIHAIKKQPRASKAVFVLSAITGGFTFLLFASYLVRQFFFPEGLPAAALAVVVMLCTLLPLLVYHPLSRLMPRFAFILLCVYCFIAVAFCVTFAIHCCETVLFPEPDTELSALTDDTVIIVFGARIKGTVPAMPLRYRLNCAAKLLEARPGALCIVSGGQGSDELIPEAEAMKNYLISLGVDADRIITEDRARNTRQNIEYSLALIEEYGLSDRTVACVSTRFHMPRIKMLMKEAGMDSLYFSADSPTAGSLIFSVIREYCSRAKVLLGVE